MFLKAPVLLLAAVAMSPIRGKPIYQNGGSVNRQASDVTSDHKQFSATQ
ncbi:MAG: hypothetical protein JRN22_04970 [Nitrososphaerota archaeon]|nr:hypothetical protein [Nitrososphaerota archaeon]